MNDRGFVKLPRTMLDWQWLDDGNTLKVYLVLLLLANWRDCEWHGISLKRGQLITSYPHIANRCGLSVQQVRTALKRLKSTGDVTVKTTSQFSIITLNNYDFDEEATGISTDEQQTVNRRATVIQQPSNSQSTTVEESKEVKELKEEKEVKEAAAPLQPHSSFNEAMPNDNPVSREDLIVKYGSENVSVYESKFDRWAVKRAVSPNVNRYGTIAKWLAEDGVVKPAEGFSDAQSSFSTDEIWQRIIARYDEQP